MTLKGLDFFAIFENMLADYDSYAKKMNDAMGFNAATGISLSDPNSGGKTFRDKQPSKTEKELELWRKRIQLLEKYRIRFLPLSDDLVCIRRNFNSVHGYIESK